MPKIKRTITVNKQAIACPLDLAGLSAALWALDLEHHVSYQGSGARPRVYLGFITEENLHTFLSCLFPLAFVPSDLNAGTGGEPSDRNTFRNRALYSGDRMDEPAFYDRHAWHYGLVVGDSAEIGEETRIYTTYTVNFPVSDLDETVDRLTHSLL